MIWYYFTYCILYVLQTYIFLNRNLYCIRRYSTPTSEGRGEDLPSFWHISNKVHLCVIVHLRIEYKHTHSPCDPRSHHESLRAMRLKRATLTTKERVSREKSPSLSLSAALWNELITPPHSPLHNNKASHDFWKLEITIYFIQCLLLLFALMLLSNTQLQ